MYVWMYLCFYVCVCMYIYMCMYIHLRVYVLSMCMYIHVCVYVCILCIYLCVRLLLYTCVCMYYARNNTYVHTNTNQHNAGTRNHYKHSKTVAQTAARRPSWCHCTLYVHPLPSTTVHTVASAVRLPLLTQRNPTPLHLAHQSRTPRKHTKCRNLATAFKNNQQFDNSPPPPPC